MASFYAGAVVFLPLQTARRHEEYFNDNPTAKAKRLYFALVLWLVTCHGETVAQVRAGCLLGPVEHLIDEAGFETVLEQGAFPR